MKRRFSEEQIIGILREQEAGGVVKEITRRHGISEQHLDNAALKDVLGRKW